ncbi:MAG: tetratricopeptide repeat protein [Terriglobia bacterium]
MMRGKVRFTHRFLAWPFVLAGMFIGLAGQVAGRPLAAPNAEPSPVEVALDHYRNLEHDQAQKQLEAWLAQHPDDLRALNYLATVILQRELLRRELMESQAYGPKGEAYQPGKPTLPAGFQEQLFDILGKAENHAEIRLRKNPRDEEALYWAGAAHVTRAIFYLSLARSDLKALGEAKEARNLHARLLAANSNAVDALLVIGVYDYVVGKLPWYLKVVASIAGHHGDKDRGLEEIRRVSEQGHWAREDGKWFLAILYFGEKRYSEALELLRGLSASYPRNYLLPQEIARAYKSQGDLKSASQAYDAMLAKHDDNAPGYRGLPLPKVLYQAGQVRAQMGEFDEALRRFDRAAKLSENNVFVYRSEFEAAGLCLRMNRREEARQRYERVVQAIPSSGEARSARQALKKLNDSPSPSVTRAK